MRCSLLEILLSHLDEAVNFQALERKSVHLLLSERLPLPQSHRELPVGDLLTCCWLLVTHLPPVGTKYGRHIGLQLRRSTLVLGLRMPEQRGGKGAKAPCLIVQAGPEADEP
eukprot:CAMPEP_0174700866 /NCGR_PEP_ID=MMETSP1094-20130205/5686_1 /TAXON_ID=156173 /ORGANISM="Chrysochromulina brevifilum, Strain UTEX LB 985" /LENGTH=111 /DNA_ID=CAMNT_0015898421 /DNA_START=417 /DNA_END=752 /DNA_ORIENTATION=+